MPEISLLQTLALFLFAFLAGLIDSIAGGGGLIQLPAILAVLPQSPVVFLLGTNKLSSSFGTLMAITQYARKGKIEWRKMIPIAVVACCAGILGALTALAMPNHWMRPLVIALLLIVLFYTLFKKDLGDRETRPHITGRCQRLIGLCAGLVIGLYDGFFGPGTGNFLILALIFIYGLDFLHASASSKVINLATNIGALGFFFVAGTIYVRLGMLMAIFNIAGNFVGVRLAILKGSRFIRVFFLIVVTGLLIKQCIDLF